jgi:coenzyme F420-reducing hydrogenase delta subunit
VQELLNQVGLEAERAQMFHMSSAMAAQFVEAAAKMTEQIAALGPSPLSRDNSEWTNADIDEEKLDSQTSP